MRELGYAIDQLERIARKNTAECNCILSSGLLRKRSLSELEREIASQLYSTLSTAFSKSSTFTHGLDRP